MHLVLEMHEVFAAYAGWFQQVLSLGLEALCIFCLLIFICCVHTQLYHYTGNAANCHFSGEVVELQTLILLCTDSITVLLSLDNLY